MRKITLNLLSKKEKVMHDYKKSYFELFNKVTDVIEELKLIQTQMEQKIISDENNDEDFEDS